MLTNSSILIIGGTGSFSHIFIPMTLARFNPMRLVDFFRDEMKQWEMAKIYKDDERLRCFIGDVRDKDRLARALKGNDFFLFMRRQRKSRPRRNWPPGSSATANRSGRSER